MIGKKTQTISERLFLHPSGVHIWVGVIAEPLRPTRLHCHQRKTVNHFNHRRWKTRVGNLTPCRSYASRATPRFPGLLASALLPSFSSGRRASYVLGAWRNTHRCKYVPDVSSCFLFARATYVQHGAGEWAWSRWECVALSVDAFCIGRVGDLFLETKGE